MTCTQWFWAEDENGDNLPFNAIIGLWIKMGDEYDFVGQYDVGIYGGLNLTLQAGVAYKCKPILPAGYGEEWSRPNDFYFTACRPDFTLVYKQLASVRLDGIGLDYWDGNKAHLKGWVRDIKPSDEICVVFIYPGLSTHNAILSTVSSTQYIYLKDTSGDYDLAANGRYIPFENDGLYAVRIIDVSGNCEHWSKERDMVMFRLEAEMTHIPVVSSNLAAVGWLNSTLEVIFRSGSHYQYDNVPLAIFEGLMDAPSKGKYFWANIRCKCHDCTGCPIPYVYRKLN